MAIRYRDIIQKAATTTWRHKFLWFFGLFAALTSNGEEYDSLFRNTNFVTALQQNAVDIKALADDGRLQEVWQGLATYVSDNTLSSVGVIVAAVIIFIFAAWLVIISQIALISSVARKDKGEPIDLATGFWSGNRQFAPVLGLNLIALAIVYGLLLLFGLPLLLIFFNTGNVAYLGVLTIVAFIILVPLNIIISFITKFAAAYVIIRGQSVKQAISKGWQLFIKNWLVSLETALILFLINFVASLLILGAVSITGLPVVSRPGFFVFFAVSAALGAVLATFQYTTWTYLFLELTQQNVVSKLIRLFSPRSAEPRTRSAPQIDTG